MQRFTFSRMIGQLSVKVSCNRLHLAGGRRGCRGAPSNEAFPCALGQRSCRVIRSSHTARAGPGPSRIISSCFVCHSFGLAYLAPKILISSSSASSVSTSGSFIQQHPALTPRCCLDHLSLCRNTSVCVRACVMDKQTEMGMSMLCTCQVESDLRTFACAVLNLVESS